jgi:hypothetical protein
MKAEKRTLMARHSKPDTICWLQGRLGEGLVVHIRLENR